MQISKHRVILEIKKYVLIFPYNLGMELSIWDHYGAAAALAIKSFRADACFLMFCFFYNISNEEGEEAARDVLHRVADY